MNRPQRSASHPRYEGRDGTATAATPAVAVVAPSVHAEPALPPAARRDSGGSRGAMERLHRTMPMPLPIQPATQLRQPPEQWHQLREPPPAHLQSTLRNTARPLEPSYIPRHSAQPPPAHMSHPPLLRRHSVPTLPPPPAHRFDLSQGPHQRETEPASDGALQARSMSLSVSETPLARTMPPLWVSRGSQMPPSVPRQEPAPLQPRTSNDVGPLPTPLNLLLGAEHRSTAPMVFPQSNLATSELDKLEQMIRTYMDKWRAPELHDDRYSSLTNQQMSELVMAQCETPECLDAPRQARQAPELPPLQRPGAGGPQLHGPEHSRLQSQVAGYRQSDHRNSEHPKPLPTASKRPTYQHSLTSESPAVLRPYQGHPIPQRPILFSDPASAVPCSAPPNAHQAHLVARHRSQAQNATALYPSTETGHDQHLSQTWPTPRPPKSMDNHLTDTGVGPAIKEACQTLKNSSLPVEVLSSLNRFRAPSSSTTHQKTPAAGSRRMSNTHNLKPFVLDKMHAFYEHAAISQRAEMGAEGRSKALTPPTNQQAAQAKFQLQVKHEASSTQVQCSTTRGQPLTLKNAPVTTTTTHLPAAQARKPALAPRLPPPDPYPHAGDTTLDTLDRRNRSALPPPLLPLPPLSPLDPVLASTDEPHTPPLTMPPPPAPGLYVTPENGAGQRKGGFVDTPRPTWPPPGERFRANGGHREIMSDRDGAADVGSQHGRLHGKECTEEEKQGGKMSSAKVLLKGGLQRKKREGGRFEEKHSMKKEDQPKTGKRNDDLPTLQADGVSIRKTQLEETSKTRLEMLRRKQFPIQEHEQHSSLKEVQERGSKQCFKDMKLKDTCPYLLQDSEAKLVIQQPTHVYCVSLPDTQPPEPRPVADGDQSRQASASSLAGQGPMEVEPSDSRQQTTQHPDEDTLSPANMTSDSRRDELASPSHTHQAPTVPGRDQASSREARPFADQYRDSLSALASESTPPTSLDTVVSGVLSPRASAPGGITHGTTNAVHRSDRTNGQTQREMAEVKDDAYIASLTTTDGVVMEAGPHDLRVTCSDVPQAGPAETVRCGNEADKCRSSTEKQSIADSKSGIRNDRPEQSDTPTVISDSTGQNTAATVEIVTIKDDSSSMSDSANGTTAATSTNHHMCTASFVQRSTKASKKSVITRPRDRVCNAAVDAVLDRIAATPTSSLEDTGEDQTGITALELAFGAFDVMEIASSADFIERFHLYHFLAVYRNERLGQQGGHVHGSSGVRGAAVNGRSCNRNQDRALDLSRGSSRWLSGETPDEEPQVVGTADSKSSPTTEKAQVDKTGTAEQASVATQMAAAEGREKRRRQLSGALNLTTRPAVRSNTFEGPESAQQNQLETHQGRQMENLLMNGQQRGANMNGWSSGWQQGATRVAPNLDLRPSEARTNLRGSMSNTESRWSSSGRHAEDRDFRNGGTGPVEQANDPSQTSQLDPSGPWIDGIDAYRRDGASKSSTNQDLIRRFADAGTTRTSERHPTDQSPTSGTPLKDKSRPKPLHIPPEISSYEHGGTSVPSSDQLELLNGRKNCPSPPAQPGRERTATLHPRHCNAANQETPAATMANITWRQPPSRDEANATIQVRNGAVNETTTQTRNGPRREPTTTVQSDGRSDARSVTPITPITPFSESSLSVWMSEDSLPEEEVTVVAEKRARAESDDIAVQSQLLRASTPEREGDAAERDSRTIQIVWQNGRNEESVNAGRTGDSDRLHDDRRHQQNEASKVTQNGDEHSAVGNNGCGTHEECDIEPMLETSSAAQTSQDDPLERITHADQAAVASPLAISSPKELTPRASPTGDPVEPATLPTDRAEAREADKRRRRLMAAEIQDQNEWLTMADEFAERGQMRERRTSLIGRVLRAMDRQRPDDREEDTGEDAGRNPDDNFIGEQRDVLNLQMVSESHSDDDVDSVQSVRPSSEHHQIRASHAKPKPCSNKGSKKDGSPATGDHLMENKSTASRSSADELGRTPSPSLATDAIPPRRAHSGRAPSRDFPLPSLPPQDLPTPRPLFPTPRVPRYVDLPPPEEDPILRRRSRQFWRAVQGRPGRALRAHLMGGSVADMRAEVLRIHLRSTGEISGSPEFPRDVPREMLVQVEEEVDGTVTESKPARLERNQTQSDFKSYLGEGSTSRAQSTSENGSAKPLVSSSLKTHSSRSQVSEEMPTPHTTPSSSHQRTPTPQPILPVPTRSAFRRRFYGQLHRVLWPSSLPESPLDLRCTQRQQSQESEPQGENLQEARKRTSADSPPIVVLHPRPTSTPGQEVEDDGPMDLSCRERGR
ncbi:uncharacterized protein LOC122368965 [Amphibalanus amphitrite]|uniref:uncharacterized protein LOC122368965 n=1 Tax=Amphibalanus amphitrite TaxID=1232801 RepID=UPI001C916BB1|nr:uncharacterized protein LOC122368965 [Amphibalanus amphitrite]